METKRKSLGQLFVPIFFETLLMMFTGMADTIMISSVGDEAVGAVGTANTYIGVFIIMFAIISSGVSAVMTQYIGAGKEGVAYETRQLGLAFNLVIGLILSAVLYFFSEPILSAVGVAEGLMGLATTYFRIVGSFATIMALIPLFSAYLRAFGHTKESLYVSFAANAINLILNAVFLYGFHLGVAGVALATVISRIVNLICVVLIAHRLINANRSPERIPKLELLGKIIRIGLPSAAETGLYNLSMTLVIRFMNQMDPNGMNVTARSYTSQISNFAYCVGAALAQANAILTGWHIGAKEYEACDKDTKRAAVIGVAAACGLEALIAAASPLFLPIFTDDPAMISLVRTLLTVDIVLEIGRASNLVFGNALKASGDALFTTVIAALFMYICAVGGTWLFGIRLGMMAVGAYIGLASDECVRAICMFPRWQSGRWKSKRLVGESTKA